MTIQKGLILMHIDISIIIIVLIVPSSPTTPDGSKVPSPRQPTNLLGTFLTFSSIVLQNVKGERDNNNLKLSRVCFIVSYLLIDCCLYTCEPDEKSVFHGRLCLIILTCIAEVYSFL